MGKHISARNVLLISRKDNYFKNIYHRHHIVRAMKQLLCVCLQLQFQNYFKQFPIPFVVYADFECSTKPMNTCSPNPEDSYTYNYQKHEPSGFCLYINGLDPNITFEPILYTKTNSTDDILAIFVSKLARITNRIYQDFYCRQIPLKINKKRTHLIKRKPVICKKELLTDKVRDHCHFTGNYRGAAHNSCNLQCRKPMILPVIFHNL